MSDDNKGPLGFGARLKRLRVARNMTHNQLGIGLRCTPSSVSTWENGEFYPGFWKLIEIAKYFGVDTDWLLGMDHVHEYPINRRAQNGRTTSDQSASV